MGQCKPADDLGRYALPRSSCALNDAAPIPRARSKRSRWSSRAPEKAASSADSGPSIPAPEVEPGRHPADSDAAQSIPWIPTYLRARNRAPRLSSRARKQGTEAAQAASGADHLDKATQKG